MTPILAWYHQSLTLSHSKSKFSYMLFGMKIRAGATNYVDGPAVYATMPGALGSRRCRVWRFPNAQSILNTVLPRSFSHAIECGSPGGLVAGTGHFVVTTRFLYQFSTGDYPVRASEGMMQVRLCEPICGVSFRPFSGRSRAASTIVRKICSHLVFDPGTSKSRSRI